VNLSRRGARGAIAALLLVLLAAVWMPAEALGDGDPGSDVLVYQPLFVGSAAGVSIPEQVKLGNLLRSSAHSGAPIRVAIISHRSDLGAITGLWHRPQAYAHFLGYELSLAYKGELLVVMPNGFGINWPGHSTVAARRALGPVAIRVGGTGLAAAAQEATVRLAAAAGVHLKPASVAPGGSAGSAGATATTGGATIPTITGPAAATTPTSAGAGGATDRNVAIGTVAVLALCALAVLLWRRRGSVRPWLSGAGRPTKPQVRRRAGLPLGRIALATGIVVVVAAAAMVLRLRPSGSTASALATNPYLDYGTALDKRTAPAFTLTDQDGHRVSLSSYRGKVTILDFNDSECTTICPLTTTAMLDAKRMLGRAGARVQLLGVDADPKATAIEDVLSYTQLHGLIGKWQFLTGSLPQLRRVWRAYGIQADVQRGLISHTPALYVIDPQGRLRALYMTQQSYASVGQLGQILAAKAASLLPGHPKVDSHLSYAPASTIPPSRATTLPQAGGGRVALGPGRARLYLFFDTWDREVMSIGGELAALNRYATTAAADGLPALTAVDEGSVEPSPAALPAFLHGLSAPLRYPVAIDTTGEVGDGYEVEGAPWLVLISASGRIAWYDAVNLGKWPTVSQLQAQMRAALSRTHPGAGAPDLIGSPKPLAALHSQASRLIGSEPALKARIRSLRGYPIVVNVWASWCPPCRAEFGQFAAASEQYGRQVAFLGADTNDSSGDAAAFLRAHHVSYPSYSATSRDIQQIVPGGLEGTPTTVFINRAGKVTHVHIGPYDAEGTLDADITAYAQGAG
jgi:cytochrome oxidase Cu insertion factor (SCO1/SenC/PrrC family)/thiol-disulfide isomerase/thioredoxin